MTSRRRPIEEQPGYVYVIAFSNGVVKVGRTQAAGNRLGEHRRAARSFGISIEAQWESPHHHGWVENEQALMRFAVELGGTPTTPEYFTGVDFDALVAKASELPFPAPESDESASPARRGVPAWFKKERARAVSRIAAGWYDHEGAIEWFVDEIIRSDKEFARLIVGLYVRKSVGVALKREPEYVAAAARLKALQAKPEPPEPPEPTAPLPVGPRTPNLPPLLQLLEAEFAELVAA
jgi:hypothetical protein